MKGHQIQKDLFWINLKILKFVGIWNPYETGNFKKYAYHVYTVFVVFVLSESIGLIYIDLFQHLNDINIMANSLPILITVSTNVIKINYFLIRHQTVSRLVKQLNGGLYPGTSTIFREEIRAKKKSFYLTVIVVGGGLLASLMAYINMTINLVNFDVSKVPLNDTEPFMPLLRGRQWYPSSWWHKYYALISIHGVLGIMIWSPPTDMGFDCLIASLFIQITCQFEVIHRRLFDYQNTSDLNDQKCYSSLSKCVMYHQNSLKYEKKISCSFFSLQYY